MLRNVYQGSPNLMHANADNFLNSDCPFIFHFCLQGIVTSSEPDASYMVQAVYDTYDIDSISASNIDVGISRFIFIGK